MNLIIGNVYLLRVPIKIYGETEIEEGTTLKLLSFDECVSKLEVIDGPNDGLQFIMHPSGLC